MFDLWFFDFWFLIFDFLISFRTNVQIKKSKNHRSKNYISLISRILFLHHHLSGPNITAGILLPTLEPSRLASGEIGIGRAALKDSYTWHYSTQGLPFHFVTKTERELLPHIFTLTPSRLRRDGAVIFCGTFSSPSRLRREGSRLFTGGLPYAVRTFLPSRLRREKRWFGLMRV